VARVMDGADVARVVQRRRIRIGQNITARLREDMHEKVMKLTLGYHRLYSPGRLLSRIMSDVGVVQSQLMQTVLNVISNTVMIVVGVTLILSIEWRMGLIAFTVPLIFLIISNKNPISKGL